MTKVSFKWEGSETEKSGLAVFTLTNGIVEKSHSFKFDSFAEGFALFNLIQEVQKDSIDSGMASLAYLVKNTINNAIGQ